MEALSYLRFIYILNNCIIFQADCNAQNASGNTPLHVCAVNNQVTNILSKRRKGKRKKQNKRQRVIERIRERKLEKRRRKRDEGKKIGKKERTKKNELL